MAGLHHVEIWVSDESRADDAWDWFLEAVGFRCTSRWPGGESWEAGGAYVTLTRSPNTVDAPHDRRRPGMNHIAFSLAGTGEVDRIMRDAIAHGWTPLYDDRYPHAGGPDHYAGWLENEDGFKVELVAVG